MTVNTTKNIGLHPVYMVLCEQHEQGPQFQDLSPEDLRAATNDMALSLMPKLPEVHQKVWKITVADREVTILVLRPLGTENELCVRSKMAVVFVEYNLAPEVKFPIAHEECYAALEWLVNNHESVKVNPDKIAIMGDSGGAHMAAGLSTISKQRGLDVIKAQALVYPAVAPHREHLESWKLYGSGEYVLTHKEANYFMDSYFPKHPSEYQDVLATPSIASKEELASLPPTLIITAECDILRDEGEAYARQITEAGADATAIRIVGTMHGFFAHPMETPQYNLAVGLIVDHVVRSFSQ
ncbi:hypothetical protein EC973_004172 [Apophysomyces ossiformis]|uniref:Alpha/beta hydrolase fold-3 domain-containing protein n=1 Tax=Apophysomyces ossiformis TaxID=679940 RepID=A0A8H7BIK7_9FUNG|nr:hypothetical protein EC973_004172 [Apophysomyces ossiformis]